MALLPNVELRFTFRAFDQTAAIHNSGTWQKTIKEVVMCFHMPIVQNCASRNGLGLDTDTVSNAFTRFTSRRGVPKVVLSDCGANFVEAVNKLKELHSQLDIQFSSGTALWWCT